VLILQYEKHYKPKKIDSIFTPWRTNDLLLFFRTSWRRSSFSWR